MTDSSSSDAPRIISPDIVAARIEPNILYLGERSRPDAGFYLWSYQVTISASDRFDGSLKLIGRHWEYGDGDAPLNGATLAGEHPTITWHRPIFRYRSATAFPEPSGQMEGYIWGEWDGETVRIPVPITKFEIDLYPPQKRKMARRSSNKIQIDDQDVDLLRKFITTYNNDFQNRGTAHLDSRQLPEKLRIPIEDYVFKSLNKKKFSEYDLADAIGISGVRAEGLRFWTSDVFSIESIDEIWIEFLYIDMDLEEYIRLTDKFLQSEELLSRRDLRASVERFRRELAAAQMLPEDAPMKYENRPDKSQNIIEYLRDENGWGPYVRRGSLTRPALLQRDQKAYQALTNWLRNPRHILPPDIHLPTKSETLAEEITDDERVREARRILRAYERRRPAPDPT